MILCLYAALPGQGLTWAERIDVATARKVAESVAQREGAIGGLRSASELALVYAAAPGQSGSALRSGQVEGAADYFVFNFPGGKGFAIVSGDDRVRPVLGYSDEGSFDPDNLPENLRGWLAGYQDQITWAISKDIEATPEIAAEWSRHMSGTTLRATEGIVLPTAKWSQYEPYNLQTPMIDGKHAVTGCVATAMGIIMKYHEHPKTVVTNGVSTYTVNEQKYEVSYAPYLWDNMPLEYIPGSYTEDQANQVAALMWNIGANVKMVYGSGESSAYTTDATTALRDVFGYSLQMKALYQREEEYSWEEWTSILRNELDNRRPVLYSSSTEENVDPLNGKGHAFVCDGYDSYGRFHFNWGWGGLHNGFYLLSSLDPQNDSYWGGYNQKHNMIINIKPNNPEENTSFLQLQTSLFNVDFMYKSWLEAWDGGVNGALVSGGNIPFEGYVALVSVDQEENIVEVLDMRDDYKLTFDEYHAGGITTHVTLKDPDVCLMLAYSSDKQDWNLIRGATPEIAYKCKPQEGPISDYPIYYDLDTWKPRHMGFEAKVIGKLEYGKPGTIQLTPLEGFALPEAKDISMQIGYWSALIHDAPVTEPFDHYDDIYWDKNTGIITIPFVSGPVSILCQRPQQVVTDEEMRDLESTEISSLTYVLNGESHEMKLKGWDSYTVVLPSDIQDSPEITLNATASNSGAQVEITNPTWIEDTAVGTITVTSKNGCNKTIYNIAFKQVYTSPVKPTHTITAVRLDNLTTSPDLSTVQKVKEGDSFEFTLIPAKDYRLPESITILNGETPLTQGIDKDYTYDKATGKVVIKAVTSDLKITASGIDDHHYEVSLDLEYLSSDPQSYAPVLTGEKIELILKPQKGYNLPASITVTMGGKTLTAGTDYTYSNGKIHIPAVTGNIVIEAKAEQITHTVSIQQQDNLDVNVAKETSVTEGSGFAVKLTAKEGYLLPETVTVKAGETELTVGTDYTYTVSENRKSGEIKINAVNSDLQIYAIGVPEPKIFTIKQELSHLTSDKDNEVKVTENSEQAKDYTITLKPEANHKLPDAITVLKGETPLTQGADKDYTYDKESGKVVIFSITSDLTIQATALDDSDIQVVFDLDGVVATPSSVGPFKINTQPQFEVAFTASEGYEYDGAFTVKMGDKDLAGTEYTYTNGTFTLNVPLTATLTITANGTKKQYTFSEEAVKNLTVTSKVNAVTHGDPLTFTLVPDDGYNLPETVTVKMGGKALTEGYTYDKANGTVSIAKVTGDVVVTAEGVLKQYDVTLHLTNLTSTSKVNAVTHGDPLTFTLVPDEGYNLPKAVTVTMGGNTLTDTYKQADGTVSITEVTGDVVVTAVADKIYKVEEEVTNLTIEASKDTIVKGETFTATLKKAKGYKLPYAIKVTMGGRLLKQKMGNLKAAITEYYTYNNETGEVKIENVDGEIVIKAKGIQEGFFEVVLNLTNLTSAPPSFEPKAQDEKVELTLTASSGYELPSGITVVMGEKALDAGTDYTYDRSTGKFSLEKITGTLVITASGSRIPDPEPEPEPTPTPVPTPVTYTVTLPVVEGATIAATGSTTVEKGNSLSFTVEVKAGYNADNMVVKANGTILTPDAAGRYTIADIRSNVVVTVSGIVKGDSPTANQEIEAGELRVWASGSRLFIRTPEAERAYIVTFDGRVYKTLSLSAGEYSEQMPQGSYIIRVGTRSYKLSF